MRGAVPSVTQSLNYQHTQAEHREHFPAAAQQAMQGFLLQNTFNPISASFPASYYYSYGGEFSEPRESAKIATFLGTVGKGQDCPEISR